MSEEKAIELLKRFNIELNNVESYEQPNAEGKYKNILIVLQEENFDIFQTILNLIEKQQKEIEELTRLKNIYKNTRPIGEVFHDLLKEKEYISKDKIREKIKELEDNMILFTNDKEKFNRYKYARNILEELLEEN